METVERSYACGEPSKVAAHNPMAGAGRPSSLLMVAIFIAKSSHRFSILLMSTLTQPRHVESLKVSHFALPHHRHLALSECSSMNLLASTVAVLWLLDPCASCLYLF